VGAVSSEFCKMGLLICLDRPSLARLVAASLRGSLYRWIRWHAGQPKHVQAFLRREVKCSQRLASRQRVPRRGVNSNSVRSLPSDAPTEWSRSSGHHAKKLEWTWAPRLYAILYQCMSPADEHGCWCSKSSWLESSPLMQKLVLEHRRERSQHFYPCQAQSAVVILLCRLCLLPYYSHVFNLIRVVPSPVAGPDDLVSNLVPVAESG
jgi:hypothetical protein